MARPPSFDRDHVLHAAERQFRTSGYNGTSVDDISAATGLGRGSLYAAFDGKHGVLLQAMNGYYARLGQADEMFRWLEVSLAERSPRLCELRTNPWFNHYRSLGKFRSVEKRIGY